MNPRFPMDASSLARVRRLMLCLAATLAALTLLGFCSRQASATVYYVNPATGSDTNTGTSWAAAFADAQAAFNVAATGDQVWLAQGTYPILPSNPGYNPGYTIGTGITVYGGFAGTETSPGQRNVAAHPSIFDGSFTANSNTDGGLIAISATGPVTFDGVTVQNGYGYYEDSGGAAAGVTDSGGGTLTFNNCQLSGNVATAFEYGPTPDGAATYGGAIHVYGPLVMTDCTVSGNICDGPGGGIAAFGTMTLTNCTISGNSAGEYGGGVYAFGTNGATASLTNCAITGNSCTSGVPNDDFGQGLGGGIYALALTLKGCTVSDNTVTPFSNTDFNYGGGVLATSGTISDSTFSGNVPDAVGLEDAGSAASPVLVKDNLIVGTGTAGPNGIEIINAGYNGFPTYATIANDTIVETGIGIAEYNGGNGALAIANTILYGNSGGILAQSASGPALTLSHDDLYDNTSYDFSGVAPGSTSLFDNPEFVSVSGGNYRLMTGSPLIDAGDDSYVAPGDTDLDGKPRIQGSHVDIGAYEHPSATTLHLTALSPAAVQAGHAAFTLTLTGTGFTKATTVQWNNTALAVISETPTTIKAAVPASLVAAKGNASVTVAIPGAAPSNALAETITSGLTLTKVSPNRVGAGSGLLSITLTGTNFVNGAVASFNGVRLLTYYLNATTVTADVPASLLATPGTAKITIANESVAPAAPLTFTVVPVPTLTSVSPATAVAGSGPISITLTGTNFVNGAVVYWNGAKLLTYYIDATTVTADVPASLLATAGAAKVTIANPGIAQTTPLTFTVTAH